MAWTEEKYIAHRTDTQMQINGGKSTKHSRKLRKQECVGKQLDVRHCKAHVTGERKPISNNVKFATEGHCF